MSKYFVFFNLGWQNFEWSKPGWVRIHAMKKVFYRKNTDLKIQGALALHNTDS